MTTFTSSLERLSAAQALFYSGTGLDDGALLKVLGRMTPAGADWADIYLQQTVSRSWILDEGAVKTGGFSIDRGAGLRTVCGETSTLAYTDVLTPVSLLDAAGTVVASAAYSPEGTRRPQPLPSEFKSGIWRLMKEFPQVELIPVYIENLHRAMPKGVLLPVPTVCSIRFGAPLEHSPEDLKEDFLERARNAIISLAQP